MTTTTTFDCKISLTTCQRPVSGSQMVAPLVAQNVTAQPGIPEGKTVIKIGTSIKSDSVQYRGPSIHTDKMDTCGLNYTVRRIELDQEVTCSFCLNCEFEGKCKFFLSGNCL